MNTLLSVSAEKCAEQIVEAKSKRQSRIRFKLNRWNAGGGGRIIPIQLNVDFYER